MRLLERSVAGSNPRRHDYGCHIRLPRSNALARNDGKLCITYHKFSNFHQATPIVPQINKYNILVASPIYHQSLVLIWQDVKNIGVLLNPKCVRPEDKVDKKLKIKAASNPGTPALINKTRNVGSNILM